MVLSIVSYIDLFISMYNKKCSVFLSFALCTKKESSCLSPVVHSIACSYEKRGVAMGIWTWLGRGVVWGALNLSLLNLLLGVSFYDKGLREVCDGAGQGSRERVPNIVLCPFSPMSCWLVRVVFGLEGAVVHLVMVCFVGTGIHFGFLVAIILFVGAVVA